MEAQEEAPQQEVNVYDQNYLIEKLNKSYDWSDLDSLQDLPKHSSHDPTYPKNFEPIYKRFYHLRLKDQVSSRAFALTQVLLIINTSNYYALMMRQKCLATQPDLHYAEEFDFVDELLRAASKEYFVWTYRKELFLRSQKTQNPRSFGAEAALMEELLTDDNKNYHVWTYRLWLVNQTKNYQNELGWVQDFIAATPYSKECYSAWHYKRMLIQQTGLDKDAQFLHKQLGKVLGVLFEDGRSMNNQCIWNYIQTYFVNGSIKVTDQKTFCFKEFPAVVEAIKKVDNRFSWYLQLKIAQQDKDVELQKNIIKKLAEIDSTRNLYYQHLLTNI